MKDNDKQKQQILAQAWADGSSVNQACRMLCKKGIKLTEEQVKTEFRQYEADVQNFFIGTRYLRRSSTRKK